MGERRTTALMRKDSMPGRQHALRFRGPINNIHEAPAIGNGDLGALVQVFHNELRLHLGKNDVWDARFENVTADTVLTQDDLIRASRDYGFRLGGPAYRWEPEWDREPPDELRYAEVGPGWQNVHPCPKPVGLVRVVHSGFSSSEMETTLDIARGVVESRFHIDYGNWGAGTLFIEAFVDRNANVVRLRLRTEGLVAPVRLLVERPPDRVDATVPPAEPRLVDDWHATVTQRVPGGSEVAPFAWHLAGAFPRPGDGRDVRPVEALVHGVRQVVSVEEGGTLELAVGVATDRDGEGDSRARALALAGDDPATTYGAALAPHEESWRRFWSASGIEIEDKELEATWYRNLFALACHIAPGAVAPGLCANVAPYDRSPWHGVYTVNMNIQKMFLASLPTNHPEWIECYAGWIDQMMPSFERLARLTFGLEGVYSVHMMLPFVPPHRQASSNTAGRALGMTGWHAQPLWWHWQYTRDRKFLQERAYPYLRKAAQFYWRYLEKYMDESGDIYPSMNLEEPAWTPGFVHNRDCICDLIMFRHTFQWAIEASEILGVDEDWRGKWQKALSRVRPVRYERLGNGRGWIARAKGELKPGQDGLRYEGHSQAMWGAWSVFPGEYIEGDEEGGPADVVRDLYAHVTERERHPDFTWIHHWWCAIPGLRLGVPGAFEHARRIILQERWPAGHAKTTHWINLQPDAWRAPEDNYLGVVGTTEMLLQSQGEVIRLFPAWPKDKRACFRDLPARGAFLVSACWDPQAGLSARILSRAGGDCRIRWREGALPAVTRDERPVEVRRKGRALVFATEPDGVYNLAFRPDAS